MTNPWDKIFEHDFEKALEIANENYLNSKETFDLRARATCFLLLKHYGHALDDFLLLNSMEKNENRSSDGTYMNIGLCYYALGDFDKASYYFQYPILNSKEIKYTSDISVPPTVLLFIGLKVKKPDVIKMATKALGNLWKFKGRVAGYLLDFISEEELNSIHEQQSNPIIGNRKQCKAEFYKAIHSFQIGNWNEYKNHIVECVALNSKYLEFEYYVAKVEYDVYLSQ